MWFLMRAPGNLNSITVEEVFVWRKCLPCDVLRPKQKQIPLFIKDWSFLIIWQLCLGFFLTFETAISCKLISQNECVCKWAVKVFDLHTKAMTSDVPLVPPRHLHNVLQLFKINQPEWLFKKKKKMQLVK